MLPVVCTSVLLLERHISSLEVKHREPARPWNLLRKEATVWRNVHRVFFFLKARRCYLQRYIRLTTYLPAVRVWRKHLTVRVNDPRTTSLITVASPETNPSTDYTPSLLRERVTNRRTCHIYESEGSRSLYILHTLTPVALSFVRARQSLTKKAKSQGVEWKPPQVGWTDRTGEWR